MSEQIENAQAAMANTMNQFSSPTEVATTDSGFLNSNGIIAKVVFLIMVIILFVFLFYIVISLISYFSTPAENPLLISGQLPGQNGQTVISQNPANNVSKPVQRSNNEETGIEFTWSVWLQYNGQNTKGSSSSIVYQPVFVKGDCNKTGTSNPFPSINNGPGVYFYVTDSIHLAILMDTVTTPASQNNKQIIDISNLPQNIYFHLAIRCQGTNIDVYINGTIIKRQNLGNVPKQNFYDVVVTPSNGIVNGFSGYLSNLQYFNRALSVVELASIYQSGPNTNPAIQTLGQSKNVVALSSTWFNSFLK